jgi:hypothetical protein
LYACVTELNSKQLRQVQVVHAFFPGLLVWELFWEVTLKCLKIGLRLRPGGANCWVAANAASWLLATADAEVAADGAADGAAEGAAEAAIFKGELVPRGLPRSALVACVAWELVPP